MRRLARPALALGSGALVALSLPPWGWWPLTFLGIAIFELTLGAQRRGRAIAGALFAAGWLAPGLGWMWFLTAPGYVIAVCVLAALHSGAAALVPAGRWQAVARPLAHTLVEALRFCFPFGGVPLASLAIAQSAGPLLWVVRLGGAVLLTWVAFQLGFAAGALARARSIAPATALAVGVGIAVLGAAAPSGHDTGRSVRIAIVQGGGPQGTRAIDTDPREVFDRHLAATRGIRPDDGVQLVVWPENVIDVPSFATSEERGLVAGEAARLAVPVLVGITEDAGPEHFLNAEVVVAADGAITSRYDKVRRVPYGEYVPLRGLLEALGAPVGAIPRDAAAGTGRAVLDTGGTGRVAVVISWEVFFGGRARDGVKAGGELLLNPTNGSSYTGTILQTQQVASSRLRAVETGRWVVQVSPTGFSAFVTDTAAVRQRTSVSEAEVVIDDVARRDGRTVYVRLGDIPFVGLAAGALVVVTALSRRRQVTPPA